MKQSLGIDWFSALLHGSPIAIFVSILLIAMSIWTWAAIIHKMRSLSSSKVSTQAFLNQFWKAKSLSEFNKGIEKLEDTSAKSVFKAGFEEMIRILQAKEKKGSTLSFETVKRALVKQQLVEEHRLCKGMGILTVSASAAPFIGLFGTVVGVVKAFKDIGVSGATSLAAVAPGISEALAATGLGLFVAIPAVIFYNIITGKIRDHMVLIDEFSADFLNILERHYSHANA